jgi:hypothetical protein
MISKLARDTVRSFRKEGLEPTFEDVIHLNALGLKVEHGGCSYEFGAVPRTAFLGDYVFTEPTVAKRLWIENAMQMMKDDYSNQISLMAFALNCPSDKLPQLDSVGKLTKAVAKFRDEVLMYYTET